MAATVTITREGDSALVLGSGTTYFLDGEGVGRPGVSWRRTAAPDSRDVHGSEYVAAAKEQSSLPLTVLVKATTYADLRAAVDELAAALEQFSYTATVELDGVEQTWHCGPADYSATGGQYDEGMVAGVVDKLTAAIPVHPVPVTP